MPGSTSGESSGTSEPDDEPETTEPIEPDDPPRQDMGNVFDVVPPDTEVEMGCEKVDFLFVIDDSGSMIDEQEQLVASFPGFIDTIQNTLTAQDYRIMVVDTKGPTCDCGTTTCAHPDAEDFHPMCNDLCVQHCGGVGCDVVPRRGQPRRRRR